MKTYPQELIDAIIGRLNAPNATQPSYWPFVCRLSPYATVSRKWQYAIERILFRSLTVKLGDMEKLEQVLSDSRRRGYLKTLSFTFAERELDGKGADSTVEIWFVPIFDRLEHVLGQ